MIILSPWVHLLVLIGMTAVAFAVGKHHARSMAAAQNTRTHSLTHYYGWYLALWVFVPAFTLFGLWEMLDDSWMLSALQEALPAGIQAKSADQQQLMLTRITGTGLQDQPWMHELTAYYHSMHAKSRMVLLAGMLLLGAASAWYGRAHISPLFKAREAVERVIRIVILIASMLAILVTISILLSVLFESLRFFQRIPLTEFLFGTEWSPQSAIRADQAGGEGRYGVIPLFSGTLLITMIAMLVAVPLGLMTAIYMSEYAHPRLRDIAKPVLEVLAGVPTVVYGFFAALTIAPLIRDIGQGIGLDVASESALAAGIVMGVMIIPFVSSLSDDVINAVPQALRDASFGLGATHSETIKHVVLPAATPGIIGAILLAFSRAIGETMIVVMAAGLAANLTINPLESVTTVTAQIVALMVGDQEFNSTPTLAAFALGLTLFVLTLLLNMVALHIVKSYRRKYA